MCVFTDDHYTKLQRTSVTFRFMVIALLFDIWLFIWGYNIAMHGNRLELLSEEHLKI